MSAIGSRTKIAAGSVAILGAALAVFLFRQDPAPAAHAPGKPAAEPSHLVAALPERAVATEVAQAPARAAPVARHSVAPQAAPSPIPKRPLSFDVPDCANLALITVANANAEGARATVQTGDSEPEQVRVGDLLEGGEVTFIGSHPETGAPIVLLEDDAKVACRAVGRVPIAMLERVGSSSPADFAARSTVMGDPHRVERLGLKLPPGTNAARADFGSAAGSAKSGSAARP